MNADYRSSHTPEEIRNLWQTPRWLFKALDKIHNFSCDIASSTINHLCQMYITKEMDAFNYDFSEFSGKVCWCNPPYSDITPWLDLAIKNRDSLGVGTILLLPADTSVKWFQKCVDHADEIVFITGGRVNFVRADSQESLNGNTKGSMLVMFKPITDTNLNTYYVDRDYLKSEGTENNERLS